MKSLQSVVPNAHFSVRRRVHMLVMLMLALSIFSFSSLVEAQSNPLRIRKTIVGNLTTVQTGQVFQYRITASCNNLTVTCGDLTLTDTLPTGLTLLGVSGPIEPLPATASGIKYVYDDPPGPTVIMRNKRGGEVGAGDFTDGEIIEFLMTVRVDSNATPGVLNNNVTGDVTQQDAGGDPPPVVHPAVPVTLLPPSPPAPDGSDWTYTKTQVVPVPPQQPTTDQPTLYQISVCPASNIGRTPYTGMTITDTYPTGANVLDADGGAVTPPQVIWTIPNTEVASAMENLTCIERELLVEYPSPAFTGQVNQSNTIVVDAAECTTTCGTSSVNFDIVAPNIQVTTSKSISGSPVGEGGIGRFYLNVSPNDGNVPAPDLVLTEDINNEPNELIRVTEIQSGRWQVLDALQPFVSVRARVEYDSSAGGTTVLGTVSGASNVVWTTLPAPPAYVDAIRWVFEYDPDGPGPDPYQPGLPLGFTMSEPPEIVFTPMTNPPFPTAFVPGIYQNCAVATFTGGTGSSSSCINYELGDPGVTGTNIGTTKTSPTGQTEFTPLQEFPLELRLRLSERALVGDTVVNPSIIDVLPAQLEFVSWDSVTFVNVTGPVPFFRRSGNTLQWYWANAPLAGSLQPAPAGLPNTVTATGSRNFTMTANGQDQDVIVRFTVRIAPSVSDNVNLPTGYTNTGYFIGPDNPICETGTVGTEASFGIDDGDGINENVCQTSFEFRVRKALALEGFKWIRNPNYATNPPRFPEFAIHSDNTVAYDTSIPTTGQSCTDAINYFEFPTGSGNFWTRFPCVAFGFPENPITALPPTGAFTAAAPNDDQFEYLLDVRNAGNVAGQDYYLYDMLPRVGDTGSGGPLSGSPRLSRFATYLTGPVVPAGFTGVTNPGNIIIEYSQAAEPCRPQVFDDPAQGGCTDDWTPTFPAANPRLVTAYRIRFAANMQISVGGRMLFRVPMVIAYDAQYGNAQIAWNSFAHTGVNSENVGGGFLPPAEPRKVGIRVPERLSLGNRVWRDSDNSGTINPPDDTNPGIAGVLVNLYADFNGDGVPDGPAIDTDTTDVNGYYLFDDIIPDANPNNNRYIVGIPASNFATVANPLYNLRSSTGAVSTRPYATPVENNADQDDNGIDPATLGQEVFSATINLTLYNERTDETDLSANPADGAFSRGTRGETNNNSDLSIDFGFFGGGDTPFSLGNRIWYDDGNDGIGGFNAAQRNNGIQDAGEIGVNGVRVELYRDGNGNNVPDAAEFIRFDTTAAGTAGMGRPGADLNGYYLFDNLDAGTYFVIIPASEFASGRPLAGWHSSAFNGTETVGAAGAAGTPATDLDDNGIEPASRRPDLNGVRSGAVVFVRVNPGDAGLEVIGETDLSLEPDPGPPANDAEYNGPTDIGPTGWDGPNSIGRWNLGVMTDDSSNVAVDFGFIPPMSLGNRVWLDDSSDTAQWGVGGSRNNSVIDATDDGNLTTAGLQNPGIAGVTLQLYYDENNNSIIDAGDTLMGTTTSAANGYYLFDGLSPGNYLVRIPSTNFGTGQPLNGLVSSFDAVAQVNPTNQTDNNDNGIDDAVPTTNGIASRQIQLIYLSESAAEADLAPAGTTTVLPGPQSRGRNGEANNDSDLTIDFGFVRPPMSIGNRVWLDDHPTNQALRNNGVQDAGETVIAGVEVALYRDLDADGVVDAGEDTGFRDTTDANGFYLFDNLPPGNYIVAITAANFNAGGPLENMISSRSVAPNPVPADNAVDNNDNGVDAFVAGVGIISSRINLGAGAEPTAETPVNSPADGANGRGTHGELDNNSNLTVDFGFYVTMSLGNRVWLDDTNTVANWNTTRNNAVLDFANDDLDNPNIAGVQGLGVAGVTLRLYRDLDADGVIDAGEDSGRTTTTNATGYYLFDALPRGNYMVGVEASNFNAGQPLNGFYSSTNAVAPTDNNTDNTDDGLGAVANPTVPDAVYGVISPSILLSYTNATTGLEPLAAVETDPAVQTQANRGTNGERDDFSNLTIDFGFVRPPMSIGNQVWLDDPPTNQALRNNGVFDAGETVIPNVEVALYRDLDADGVVDAGEDTGFRDTTDANGFYLFGNLSPGNYIVAITTANFNTGGPLENMVSSRSVAPNPLPADNAVDNNDNGIDTPVAGIGIISSSINLGTGAEPTAETPVNSPADGPNGRGINGETDNNSNLTVDFGFYVPMSLGNRVWLDDSNDTASTTRNNAILDTVGDDLDNPNIAGVQGLGVAGVTLRLYRDLDADGVIDAGEDSGRTTTTNATGYYLFDALPRGNYIVGVEASNFTAGQPLNGFYSSTNAVAPTDNNTDNTDDGLGAVANPTVPDAVYGVISPSILLSYTNATTGLEPLAAVETDPAVQTQADRGANGERDDFSNLTIDFGFVRPPMSIGNQVWLDDHPTNQALRNNGIFDAGETAIPNVEVALYRDLDADGVVDAGEDTGLRDTTDANGFYLFGNLSPGNYIVAITAANFNTGGPLENMVSSRSTAPNPLAADSQTDNNDNGIDTPVAGIGVISSSITLAPTTEAVGETPVNTPADGPNGRGINGELDNNSDLTVDFGFYVPMSLGNRVWLDDSDNPASTTRNNAILDAAGDNLDNPNIAGVQGLGVAGVTLRLYNDLDADGVIDAGEDSGRTTTTNANGYYLFDALPRGSYIVGVEASNFNAGQPLFGFYSSTNAVAPTDNNTDNTDDGHGDAATPDVPDAVYGIISPSILLSYTTATTGLEPLAAVETDPAPQTQADRGANGERDAFSNLTIDFGFARPAMSLGNQVWLDDHPTNQALRNNGIFDAGETVIAGVEVALYRDLDADGVVDAGEDTGLRDTTDANGFYLFGNLSPGNYIVAITTANFNIGGPLENMVSSRSVAPNPLVADSQTDNNDNGIDTPVAGVGVISSSITLAPTTEAVGETPVNTPADGPNGRGTNGEADNNSDLTVDFGFYVPMSLGNRVWLDDTNNSANWPISRNNAILDFTNDDLDNPNIAGVQGLGVAGVTLRLYNDLDADGVIDAGEDSGRTTTTNANGYYLFDGLPRGNYIVGVEASNFNVGAPLEGFLSSTNAVAPTDNNTDNTDDGLGAVGTPDVPDAVYGVISPSILLSYTNATTGLEPLAAAETDPAPQTQADRGANGERDAFSNLTIDFGFARPPMSIGNRVWFDGNNNGLIDTTGTTDDFVQGGAVAPGIPGVTVRLFFDVDTNGVPDSATPVVPDVVTDANGHYLFTNLLAGNYIVALPNTNFAVGQPLAGLISSTGNAGDNQTDSDDNGIDLRDATFGLLSPTINLTGGAEPVGETDLAPAGNGAGISDNNGEMTIDFGLFIPMSIGNRLWFDTNGNSVQNVGEPGVPAGVPVGLYRDDNNDNTPDGPAVATTTTDANGYYLFDGLGIGRYIVIVEEMAFQAGGILQNYLSSTGEDTTDNTDLNDNGINNATPAVGGIRSNVITLALTTAPTTETDLGPGGNGTNGETNNNSNLTVDFGFINAVEMSLGNLVWIDNGGTGSGIARDGIRNGDELPVANVVVNLYQDANTDGIPDDLGAPGPAGDIVATDTTDVNGQYLFDRLAAGNYIVELAASNFAAGGSLDGYGSTTTATVPDQNNNDYGIDTPDTLTGIRSGTIVLAVNTEPTGDTDPVTVKGYGGSGIDNNSNMTVDFGVYRPLSIGNRVWFDTNSNGTINAGEPGIASVTIELRADTNNNGTFEPLDDLLVTTPGVTATDVTDANGYYLFSNLLPGTYFVYIPPSEFALALTGYTSTTDNVGGIAADNNDNGVSDGGTGIVSNLITLADSTAPTNETDLSSNPLDGPRFIGLNGENNANSNISIDFGFIGATIPMSLGNRVWLDNNNNGLIDAGDDYDTVTAGDQPGIPGVVVNLYVDSNSDGIPDGAVLRTDTTDANGYYLFGNLPPGNYLVQIAPVNFQAGGVLRGLFSSTGTNNDQITDINDNGIDNLTPASTGILSATISLVPSAMPLGETDLSANPADGPDSRGNNGETDGNSNLTIDFGLTRRFDWGDAPDSYGTTNGAGGPSHGIISTLFLGSIEDNEADGQPNPAADGDDNNGTQGDDEDGVTLPVAVAGTNLRVDVRVFNNTGTPATVTGWIDFSGNGTFEAGEAVSATVPPSQVAMTITLVFPVPATADVDTGGQTYARFRLTTDPTITTATPGGQASDGEVEDYVVTVNPPGVSVTKTDGFNAIVVGQTTTYTITIQYSGLTGITRIVNDTVNPATAFDPASLSWTCDANGQASCVTGQPLGTDIATDTDAATPPVAGLMTAQSIDLEQGGELVYRLTGTLIADYNIVFPGVPDIVNTVALDSGETASDTNGVIFDPPFGIKTGTVLNDTTIRWTMVWFNTRSMQAASITDVLDPSQTNPTNLVCTPFGTTTTNLCEIQGGNTIFWDGIIGDGTNPTDRVNNRLEITFEVTVPGTGTYNNVATLTTAGGDTFQSPASVVVGSGGGTSPGGSSGGSNGGSGVVLDPTITKTVDQEFTFRGGTVTWTIQVKNPFNLPIDSVTVNDNMPEDLEILSTSTTNGTVTVVGQLITVNIPTLNPQETVTITFTTRVSKTTTAEEFANFADLFTVQRGKLATAGAVVKMVGALPDTGEVPVQREIIRLLLLTLAPALVVGGIGFRVYRRRTAHR